MQTIVVTGGDKKYGIRAVRVDEPPARRIVKPI